MTEKHKKEHSRFNSFVHSGNDYFDMPNGKTGKSTPGVVRDLSEFDTVTCVKFSARLTRISCASKWSGTKGRLDSSITGCHGCPIGERAYKELKHKIKKRKNVEPDEDEMC